MSSPESLTQKKPNLLILNGEERLRAIAESHKRSRRRGLDPGLRSAPALSAQGLQSRVLASEPFLSLAVEQIALLRKTMDAENFFIAVTDSEGYIIYTDGGLELSHNLARRNCAVGYQFCEETVGTTAISLCLKLWQPFQLSDKDHYFQKVQNYTSSAAPVFGPEGNLLGVLMVTGEADLVHIHTLALITGCAWSIGLQLTEIWRRNQVALEARILDSTLEAMGTGLMILDDKMHLTRVNEMGRRIAEPELLRQALMEQPGLSLKAIERYPEQWNNREFSLNIGLDVIHLQLTARAIILNDNYCAGIVLSYNKVNALKKVIEAGSGSLAYFTFDDIAGHSPSMGTTIKLARRAALTDAPVLIQGETGTGKELLAQAIHNASSRRGKPFVPINCGAIPKELLESELFGYVHGAFTGASKGGLPGKFEMASGGTLLLDEIGDMPYSMQLRLLRVLQTQEIYRLGSSKPTPVDIRVIASTNVDLDHAIACGRFRHDLYFRLNVFPLFVPPLRERGPEEIIELAEYFLAKSNPRPFYLSPECKSELAAHRWPGNVRELENCMCRAAHLADGALIASPLIEVRPARPNYSLEQLRPVWPGYSPVSIDDESRERPLVHHNLPPGPIESGWRRPDNSWTGGSGAWPGESLDQKQCRLINDALTFSGGDIARTCRATGLSRATLYRRMKKYHLKTKDFK